EELFLAAEVVIDRGEVDPRGGGEAPQARRLEAVLHELGLGGVEDAGLGVRGGRVLRDALPGGTGCGHGAPNSNERLNSTPPRTATSSSGSLRGARALPRGPGRLRGRGRGGQGAGSRPRCGAPAGLPSSRAAC